MNAVKHFEIVIINYGFFLFEKDMNKYVIPSMQFVKLSSAQNREYLLACICHDPGLVCQVHFQG